MMIRAADRSDAGRWQSMRDRLWPGDPHGDEIAAYFAGAAQEPQAVLLAEFEPGAAIAVIELSIRIDLIETNNESTGYVEGLFVEPAHRASGVARGLLRSAQEWSRRMGCRHFASDRDDRVIVDHDFSH